MQQNYSKKIEPIQKATKNTASSVLDASSQSESLQRKADMANNAAQREEAPRPNNTGMPDNLKSGIESLSGFSMDDVRVHYNSSKPATVQALAYTQGTDIHVAPGQEKHLPHEAWHVAQQMAGRVSPTTNINGMPVNDNAGLEHEADVMGTKATQMKSDESKTVQKATIWNGVAQRVNLEDYYYHLSSKGIPEDKPIDPMWYLRERINGTGTRGDDLGPGFYMGDSNFLPYYYKKNFTSKDVYIYYIGKNLIESENMKKETTDFTESNSSFHITEDNDLFQIAMQLGFRRVDETNVTNHLRPLDLLAPKKTDESTPKKTDESTPEKTDESTPEKTNFGECVSKIYEKEENPQNIIDFFEKAKDKAIWKGYINDIDNEQKIITLNEAVCKEIINNNTNKVDESQITELREELNKILPRQFEYKKSFSDEYTTFCNNLRSKILAIRNKMNPKPNFSFSDFISNYRKELEKQQAAVKYNCLENKTGVKPIQIAIRQDVEVGAEGVKKVTLLEKIKKNEIPITDKDIESARTKLKTAGTKSETKGDAKNEEPKQEPLKTAETEPATKGDAINEGSKLELLKVAGTESATSKDLKSESKPAGTKPEASDDLKNQLKTVLAVAKEEKLAEDSPSGNK